MENNEKDLITGVVVSEIENYYESKKALAYILAAVSLGSMLGFSISYLIALGLCRIL